MFPHYHTSVYPMVAEDTLVEELAEAAAAVCAARETTIPAAVCAVSTTGVSADGFELEVTMADGSAIPVFIANDPPLRTAGQLLRKATVEMEPFGAYSKLGLRHELPSGFSIILARARDLLFTL